MEKRNPPYLLAITGDKEETTPNTKNLVWRDTNPNKTRSTGKLLERWIPTPPGL
jgi:hypothetical protein